MSIGVFFAVLPPGRFDALDVFNVHLADEKTWSEDGEQSVVITDDLRDKCELLSLEPLVEDDYTQLETKAGEYKSVSEVRRALMDAGFTTDRDFTDFIIDNSVEEDEDEDEEVFDDEDEDEFGTDK